MTAIKIETAAREGARIVLGLAGTSGGGKTYTAILLAYGLAKRNAAKVGFLDTENRRGRLYADVLPNRERFLIADLTPPYSPARYIEAIQAFEAAGVEVLVIDSVTHEWEGTGGCEEIATAGDPKIPRWNKAKAEHKRFMNALLASSMHVICCIRAREKVKMSKGARGETVIEPLGIQPIQEKNFMFELTASLMMREMGKSQDVLKCPAALLPVFGHGAGYLGIDHGEQVRAWVDGAEPVNRETERARASLLAAAESGLAAMEQVWKGLPVSVQRDLKDDLPALKSAAQGYDAHRKIATEGADAATGVAAALKL